MRGFHDEMGGPESVAGLEWGRGVGMTAAGLPATPATPWLNRIGFPPKTYEGRSSDSPSPGLPASPGVVVRDGESFRASFTLGAHRPSCDPSRKDSSGRVCWGCSDAPSALPSEKLTWEETQHSEMLRHNFLLRRHLTDPGYGASRELSWREKAANGLGVASVPSRGIHGQILSPPSE